MGRYDKIGTYVSHKYGSDYGYNLDTENVAIKIVESSKGVPFEAIEVFSDAELYQKLKIRDPVYFACSNSKLIVMRAVAGESEKAIQPIATTETDFKLPLEAKADGDYEIKISTSYSNGVNRIIVKEDGYQTETHKATNLLSLVKYIIRDSQIINVTGLNTIADAESLFEEDADKLAANLTDQVEFIFGAGTDGTPGTNGTVGSDGKMSETDLEAAVEVALANIENLFNPQPAIIFTNSESSLVQNKIDEHIVFMNKKEVGKWRLAVLGCPSDASLQQKVSNAKAFAKETIWYVCHDLLGIDEKLYTPAELTSAVAGALVKTPYNVALWGGQKEKVLGVLEAFFKDVGTVLDETEQQTLTENGCITFTKDKYGVKIYKSVTTATVERAEYEAHEGTGVRIAMKAKRVIKDALDEKLSELMDDIIDSELKSACGIALDQLVQDGALVAFPNDGIPAYDIQVQPIPKSAQGDGGKAYIKAFLSKAVPLEQSWAELIID